LKKRIIGREKEGPKTIIKKKKVIKSKKSKQEDEKTEGGNDLDDVREGDDIEDNN
jgi:hypothetical protein